MKNSVLIHEVTPDEITKLFHGLQQQLNDLKKNFEPKQATEYLTRNEVAKLLKIDLSSVHNWCKKGKLVPYGIAGRIYFKRSDIENSLVNLGRNKGGENE